MGPQWALKGALAIPPENRDAGLGGLGS